MNGYEIPEQIPSVESLISSIPDSVLQSSIELENTLRSQSSDYLKFPDDICSAGSEEKEVTASLESLLAPLSLDEKGGKKVTFEPIASSAARNAITSTQLEQTFFETVTTTRIISGPCPDAEYYSLEQLKSAALSLDGLTELSGESVIIPNFIREEAAEYRLAATYCGHRYRLNSFAYTLIQAEKKALVGFCKDFRVPYHVAHIPRFYKRRATGTNAQAAPRVGPMRRSRTYRRGLSKANATAAASKPVVVDEPKTANRRLDSNTAVSSPPVLPLLLPNQLRSE